MQLLFDLLIALLLPVTMGGTIQRRYAFIMLSTGLPFVVLAATSCKFLVPTRKNDTNTQCHDNEKTKISIGPALCLSS